MTADNRNMFGLTARRDQVAVLLIDDDLVSREVTATLLTLSGYAVHTAENGDSALDVLATMKPEPEIYQAAIARAGCRPEECFYTDDIARFVTAARSLGIDGVEFQSAAQLQGEMKARGIRWE